MPSMFGVGPTVPDADRSGIHRRLETQELRRINPRPTAFEPEGSPSAVRLLEVPRVRSAATRTTASTPPEWAGHEHARPAHGGGIPFRE